MQTSRATICNQKGFTLIEIIVVMAMLVMFATMAMPRMRDKMDLNLKKRARMISAAMQYVYNQAAFKNETYRLHFDLDKQTYAIEVAQGTVHLEKDLETRRKSTFEKKEEPKAKFAPDTSMIKKPIELEKGLKFKDVKTEAKSFAITSGHAYTHFFPFGYAEKTQIRLESEKGTVYSIVVNPLTGSAKVYDYDIEEKKSF